MRGIRFGLFLFKWLRVIPLSVCFTKCGNVLDVAAFVGFFLQPVITTVNILHPVCPSARCCYQLCEEKGAYGSKHHASDRTKFSDTSTEFKSIQKKKGSSGRLEGKNGDQFPSTPYERKKDSVLPWSPSTRLW